MQSDSHTYPLLVSEQLHIHHKNDSMLGNTCGLTHLHSVCLPTLQLQAIPHPNHCQAVLVTGSFKILIHLL